MSGQRRKRGSDREASQKAAKARVITFWQALRSRYPSEVADAADVASERLTLADLRALEAAELMLLEQRLASTTSHKARAIIRNAMTQARKNLFALVAAESPTYDLNDQPIVLPEWMASDGGPEWERQARRLEHRAMIEAAKLEILAEQSEDGIQGAVAEAEAELARVTVEAAALRAENAPKRRRRRPADPEAEGRRR